MELNQGLTKARHKQDLLHQVPHLPLLFTESLQRNEGLALIAGNRHSRLPQTLGALLREIAVTRSGHGLIVTDQQSLIPTGTRMNFVTVGLKEFESGHDFISCKHVDLIVIDRYDNFSIIEKILKLVEAGCLVLWAFFGSSLLNGLRQIYSHGSIANSTHLRARFADAFFAGIYQTCLPGIQEELVYAFEVLLNKIEIQAYLQQDLFDKISLLQEAQEEQAGVLSMNQCLLQLIIRRKIDIKTAFKYSKNPQNLDQLLKKLGI